MTFVKLPPVPHDKIHHGCLNCGGTYDIAPMDTGIQVGFGSATITKDGATIFDGEDGYVLTDMGPSDVAVVDGMYELQWWEDEAKKDPDHDWRANLYGPLRGRVYQRQGEAQWVLVESDGGFA